MKGNKGVWALCMATTFDILSYRQAFACSYPERDNDR
jgi:hypothetical protein